MGYYVLKAESYNDDVKSHQEERPSQICKRKIIQKKIQCYRISIFSSKVNNEICKTSLKRKKPQEKKFVKFKLFKNFLMSSKKLMSATTSSYSNSTSDYFGTTSMLKTLHTRLRAFVVFASKVWTFICYVFRKQTRAIIQHKAITYNLYPLSPLSKHRLSIVKRKTLVLDLVETLIHSFHDGVLRPTVKPGTPPDFILKVTIDRHPVRFLFTS